MNNNDENIFQSLIAGGLIGAALGGLLSKNKGGGATLGALAGAAILATYKANQEAMKTNIPVYVVEDSTLYEVQPGGERRFIKNIPKSTIEIPKHFTLK